MNSALPPPPSPSPSPPPHTALDDAQALLTGTLFVSLGLALFKHAGLVTGGTAGLAFIAHYATAVPFGVAFFVINLPFYALAWQRMGARFTVKTFAAVGLLSAFSEAMPVLLQLQQVQPVFAALGGGLLMGAGMLMLFRHRASLGGLNVLVLWLQEKHGWRAGQVQSGVDLLILLAATPWLSATQLALSVAGAVALNATLAINHRQGRYAAV
jgi:uncharacterized membrane-anchored protein YitT (DUF2179 family)